MNFIKKIKKYFSTQLLPKKTSKTNPPHYKKFVYSSSKIIFLFEKAESSTQINNDSKI